MEASTVAEAYDHFLQEEENKVEFLKNDLLSLRKARVEDNRKLAIARDSVKKQLQDSEQQTIDTLRELYLKSSVEVDEKHKDFVASIDDEIRNIDAMVQKVNSGVDKTKETMEESQKDITAKECVKREAKTVILNIHSKIGHEALQFEFDKFIEDVPKHENVGHLSLVNNGDRHIPTLQYQDCEYTVTNTETRNMQLHYGDTRQCRFVDLCQLQDGSYTITDIGHGQVLHLDAKLNILHYMKLDCPWGICYVRRNEVAVTLIKQKKVQKVTITEENMELGHSFQVDEACRGILFHNNSFYVCCGGGSKYWKSVWETYGNVKVYSYDGIQTSVFMKNPADGRHLFERPRCIKLNPDKTRFYIADIKQGVIVMGLYGSYESTIVDPDIQAARSLTFDERDNLFVACKKKNQVVQFGKNADKLRVMLTQVDLNITASLKSIHYDKVGSNLLVICEGNEIQLLQFKAI